MIGISLLSGSDLDGVAVLAALVEPVCGPSCLLVLEREGQPTHQGGSLVYRAEARQRGKGVLDVRLRAWSASARQPSREGIRWFTEPKLAEGERRLVDLTGIEPVTS